MTDSKLQQPLVDAEHLRTLTQGNHPLLVIDVRSAEEFAAGTVAGAINVPADQISARATEFPKNATIVAVCNHGGSRSCGAAEQLRSMGFEKAVALKGGVRGFAGS